MSIITTEVEVRFRPSTGVDLENAFPTLEIEFSYTPGRPPCTPRGGSIDSPDSAEVTLIQAKLIKDDGLLPDWLGQSDRDQLIEGWASDYLDSDVGYEKCCALAESER